MKILKRALAFTAALVLNHCGSNNTAVPIGTSYYSANGSCYATGGAIVANTYCTTSTGYAMSGNNCVNSSGTVVSISYCTGSGVAAGSYTYSNGYCQNSNGQIVASSYCNGVGGGAIECIGTYYTQSYSGMQAITCTGSNCSGKTLFNAYGAPVVCL